MEVTANIPPLPRGITVLPTLSRLSQVATFKQPLHFKMLYIILCPWGLTHIKGDSLRQCVIRLHKAS